MAKVTHTLAYPIEVTKRPGGGKEKTEVITEITLDLPERLKAKHLRYTDGAKGEVGKTLALLSAFTGQPVKVLDELDAQDLEALAAHLEPFS